MVVLKICVLLFYVNTIFLFSPLLMFTSSTPTTSDQAEALLKWKSSLPLSPISLDSWNHSNVNNLGHWTGISCSTITTTLSSRPTVSEINLFNASISGGTLNQFSFVSFQYLTHLSFSHCDLTGKIPPEIGQLKHLKTLWLEENQFSGLIPPTIGNLTKLVDLYLSGNSLSSPIPVEIGKCTYLEQLDLARNQFSGLILPAIGNLQNLTFLMLYCNNLSGPIPPEFGNLKAIWKLDLSYNQLSGPIPQTFGNMSSLLFAYLDFNLLQGPLPVLPHVMAQFSAAHNMLTGEISSSICNSKSLKVLDLSYNSLGGEIPLCLGKFIDVWNLDLSHNQLSGPIPQTLFVNMSSLRYAHLDSNLLRGPFPVLPYFMQAFSAANNMLTGEIPSSNCNASNLEFLDLSNNSLGGEIPRCFGNLSSLSLLKLQLNRFQGTIPSTIFTNGSALNTERQSIGRASAPVFAQLYETGSF